MILSADTAQAQLDALLNEYPNLKIVESNEKRIQLSGTILVHREYNDFSIRKEYSVNIIIPLNSDKLPSVIDIENQIDRKYPHRYRDGSLCLATDTQIRLFFVDGFNLLEWMDKFVEPYYFSYEYFSRFQVFPFGERSHNDEGILETYQDIFLADTIQNAYSLIAYIAEKPYRGHLLCPCGSGKRTRNCHGEKMMSFYNNSVKKQILKNDYSHCIRTSSKRR